MENIDYSKIEDLARLQFTTDEVAILCLFSPAVFEEDSEALQAFMRGRLGAQAEVRSSVLVQSISGNTQSQKHFQDLADNSEQDISEDQ